jgi:hypothetical protein
MSAVLSRPCTTSTPGRRFLSSELMAAVAEVEARFPVGEWRVGDVPVWPLLRVRWCCAEFERQYGIAGSSSQAASGVLRRMLAGRWQATRAKLTDAAGNDSARPLRDLVFLSDGMSFARIGSRYVERFCDPLIAVARTRGLSTALWTPLHQYHRPRATPSVWLQSAVDGANLAGYALSRVAPSAAHLPELATMSTWLDERGLDGARFSTRRIVVDAMRLRAISALYRRRLRAAQPMLAFLVSYYSLEGMAFIQACHDSGVTVVDLQHGVQGPLHPCYAAWPRPAGNRRHPLLPDVFWTWSATEAQTIEQWSAGTAHAALAGGNPWLNLWRADSTWPGVAQARQGARALHTKAAGLPVALVTLQYGLAAEEQLQPLAALLRAARGRLAVWVRLHPAMLERREEVRGLLAEAGPFELEAPTELPLHALLPESDVHLTHSSTTVIEAAQAGRHSVLTSCYGEELFASLIDAGFARIETGDTESLLQALLEAAARRAGSAGDPSAVAELPDMAAALGQLLSRVSPPKEEQP